MSCSHPYESPYILLFAISHYMYMYIHNTCMFVLTPTRWKEELRVKNRRVQHDEHDHGQCLHTKNHKANKYKINSSIVKHLPGLFFIILK